MKTDRIISIAAIVIALATLGFIGWQTTLQRQSTYASMLPYLQISYTTTGTSNSINIANIGIGPALVDSITVYPGTEKFAGDPYAYYMARKSADQDLNGLYADRLEEGLLIPAGHQVNALGSRNSRTLAEDIAGRFTLPGNESVDAVSTERAVIEVVYASVYGEHWRVRSDQLVPTKLEKYPEAPTVSVNREAPTVSE